MLGPLRTQLFALLVLAASGTAGQALDRSPCALCGTWSLIDLVDRDATGVIVPDPSVGPRPTGVLIYDRLGNVAVQIMPRPEGAGAGEQPQPAGDVAGYLAYFGTYRLDAASGTVTHKVAGNLIADDVGKSFTRSFILKGDQLELSFAAKRGEVAVKRTLRWRRLN